MQIVRENRPLQASGMLSTKQFSVKVDTHIMHVLSGLYKNPVDAIVREYLSNMHDAWIALKRANSNASYQPCELHLPTVLSPVLVFKDYGIGMDFDTVWEVYTQYGNSTKGDNNEEVGGFGLGSKTAFCYNNGQQWSIESRWNGQLMTFSACIDANGMPSLMHVGTVPTDERNGVTIRIPIKREDVSAVLSAAEKYVPYYPMDIVVVNGNKEIDAVPNYVLTGKNWGLSGCLITKPRPNSPNAHISPSTIRTSITGVHIVMGNVPYEVSINPYSKHHPDALLPNMRKVDGTLFGELAGNYIAIHVPVGTLDIVPSRDSLKYTERTNKALMEIATEFKRDFANAVNEYVRSAQTEWEATVRLQELNRLRGFNIQWSNNEFKWRGITLTGEIRRTTEDLRKIDPTGEISCYGLTSAGRATPELISVPTLRPSANHWVMIDDTTKGGVNVAKAYCYTHLVNRSPNSKRPLKWGHKIGHVILVKTRLSKKQLSEFFGGYPETEIITANEVSGRVINAPGPKGNDALYRFDGGKTWSARVNIPTGGPFYYLKLEQNSNNNRWLPAGFDSQDVKHLLNAAAELGIKVEPALYGIKKDEVGDFDSNNWKCLVDEIRQTAQSIVDKNVIKFARRSMPISDEAYALESIANALKLEGHSDFQLYMEEMKKQKSAHADDTVEEIYRINTFLTRYKNGVDLPDYTDPKYKIPYTEELRKEIIHKHPILGLTINLVRRTTYYGSQFDLEQIQKKVVQNRALIESFMGNVIPPTAIK